MSIEVRSLLVRNRSGQFQCFERRESVRQWATRTISHNLANAYSIICLTVLKQDFVDSYRNLTLKSIMWLKWTSDFCPNAQYVLKLDDDLIVNVFNLVNHMMQLWRRAIARNASILCLVWNRMTVVRDQESKWYISKAEYSSDNFSTYCSGNSSSFI